MNISQRRITENVYQIVDGRPSAASIISGAPLLSTARRRRASTNLATLTEDQQYFRDRAIAVKQAVKDRLENGYQHVGGFVGGSGSDGSGYYQDDFKEIGLRSNSHALLSLFSTKLPRKQIGISWNKQVLSTESSKVLARDMPYIVGNDDPIGFIRVDIDESFTSHIDLYEQLSMLLAPEALPNLAVSFHDSRSPGEVIKPHLIWILPQNSGVYPNGDKKPQMLLSAVQRALVAKLLPLGADPGGLSNALRVKNPLSPHTTVGIISESPQTLSVLFDNLPGRTETRNALEQDAIHRDLNKKIGFDEITSNNAFTNFTRAAADTLREWKLNQDSRLDIQNRKKTARRLLKELRGSIKDFIDPRETKKQWQLLAILWKVCKHFASHFDPARIRSRSEAAGIMRASLNAAGIFNLRQRKRMGAMYTNRLRADRTLNAILDAMEKAGARDPLSLSKSKLAELSGITRRTIQRRWKDIVDAVQQGFRRSTTAASFLQELAEHADQFTNENEGNTTMKPEIKIPSFLLKNGKSTPSSTPLRQVKKRRVEASSTPAQEAPQKPVFDLSSLKKAKAAPKREPIQEARNKAAQHVASEQSKASLLSKLKASSKPQQQASAPPARVSVSAPAAAPAVEYEDDQELPMHGFTAFGFGEAYI